MSGGSFDYGCHSISNFADAVEERIAINDCANGDDLGPNDLANAKACYNVIKQAAILAHALEWLYSGDYGGDEVAEKMHFVGISPLLPDDPDDAKRYVKYVAEVEATDESDT